MRKITNREIRDQHNKRNPLSVRIMLSFFCLIFALFIPGFTLFGFVKFIVVDGLKLELLIFIAALPIVICIGLLFLSAIFVSVKNELLFMFRRYKIVRAKCIKFVYKKGVGDECDTRSWVFKASDGEIETKMGVPEGNYAYLVMVGEQPFAVFDANDYYTDNYSVTFDFPKELSISAVFGHIFLETFLSGTIALNLYGFLSKTWYICLFGANPLIFYILGSVLSGVHVKFTVVISTAYLFVNGILFYHLSYTYSHSAAAYIVGTVLILAAFLICYIWYKIKCGKNKV